MSEIKADSDAEFFLCGVGGVIGIHEDGHSRCIHSRPLHIGVNKCPSSQFVYLNATTRYQCQ